MPPILPTDKITISRLEERELYSYLRSAFGGVGNNPLKSLIYLLTPLNWTSYPRITREVNEFLEVNREDPLTINHQLIRTYFDSAILELTQYAEKKETKLAKRSKYEVRKTQEGLLIGDISSFLCIDVSSDNELDVSSQKIFGHAHSSGERDSITTTLFLLQCLKEKGKTSIAQLMCHFSESGYSYLLRNNLTDNNIKRLNDSGIVVYESEKTSEKEKIKYRLINPDFCEEDLSKLEEIYSKKTLYHASSYSKDILEVLEKHGKITPEEITYYLNEEKGRKIDHKGKNMVYSILKALELLGNVEHSGPSNDEYSSIEMTEKGRKVLDHFEPFLCGLGFDEVMEDGLHYSNLKKVVEPDIGFLKFLREEYIDPLIRDEKKLKEFQEKVKISLARHMLRSNKFKKDRKRRVEEEYGHLLE